MSLFNKLISKHIWKCRRHSLYGVRVWLTQRALEGAFRRFIAYFQDTWVIAIYLRCLGAKIGSWVTFRHCNVQTVPDMLKIGDGTHVGDMANIVTSCALDSGSMLIAPINLGQQVRVQPLHCSEHFFCHLAACTIQHK